MACVFKVLGGKVECVFVVEAVDPDEIGFILGLYTLDGGSTGFCFVLRLFDEDWILGGNTGTFSWGVYWAGGVEIFGGKYGVLTPFAFVWDIGGKTWKKKKC